MEKLNQEILDKLTKVCLCKAITKAKIKDSIRKGATTLEEVNKEVGSGSGGCSGRRCSIKIKELLEQYKEKEWM